MARILLLRHGQSEWNADGRWQGQADPPLSDLGRHQAAAAAAHLPHFDSVIASDLERARTTASILADLAGLGSVRHEPDLRERAAGDWEGLDRSQIEQGWPGYLGEGQRPTGFENDETLLIRTTEVLDRLVVEFSRQQVLAVCHGGVIRAHERSMGDHESGRVPNLGGRWLEYEPDSGFSLGPRVVLIDEDITAPPET